MNVIIDDTGKNVKYRLADMEQKRNTRDDTLSKRVKYSISNIEKIVSKNASVFSQSEIKNEYEKFKVEKSDDFELMAPVPLNLVCFRFKPKNISDEIEIERLNQALLNTLNESGKILLTQTRLDGKYVIRFVGGQVKLRKEDVEKGWELIRETCRMNL